MCYNLYYDLIFRADELLEYTTLEIRTIHSAKGLEWKNIVVDLRGFKPYDNSEGELAEECRVLYVAMSWAKELLYLLGNNQSRFPNLDALQRFLDTQLKGDSL